MGSSLSGDADRPAAPPPPSGATLGRRPENIRGLRLPPALPGPSGALVPTSTPGGRRLQEVLGAHLSAAGGGAAAWGGPTAPGATMAELETVGVVRNAVHLQADTLRLLPVPAAEGDARGGDGPAAAGATAASPPRPAPSVAAANGAAPPPFTFDATVCGAVTVFFHAREVSTGAASGDAPAGAPPVGVAARYTGGGGGAGGAPTRTRFAVGRQQVYRQKASAALDVTAGEWVVRAGGSGGGGNVWPLVICLATGWGGKAPGGTAPPPGARGRAAAPAAVPKRWRRGR
ncbi:hypothetical protein BU14_0392s0020 [Porphyra umbilicalis]|uniref:Uncharacterized protein n=1 Tax=Porphyra umbilicalis TaxID=2786 RepID=A0A1X6NWK5_PORUM|nr:hypothetical protein BU14_0392s0020 [Porphyra umbilicalis]|eukprot:OSX72962.1 hypothetical protein BU14_0392s0020 [Porphyra umbilicalis]